MNKELKQSIEFLEANALKNSKAKTIILMGDMYECLKPIRELAERATPKKVKFDKSKYGDGFIYSCPVCGRMLGINCTPSFINFCDDCGQAIDWSEQNE